MTACLEDFADGDPWEKMTACATARDEDVDGFFGLGFHGKFKAEESSGAFCGSRGADPRSDARPGDEY